MQELSLPRVSIHLNVKLKAWDIAPTPFNVEDREAKMFAWKMELREN